MGQKPVHKLSRRLKMLLVAKLPYMTRSRLSRKRIPRSVRRSATTLKRKVEEYVDTVEEASSDADSG